MGASGITSATVVTSVDDQSGAVDLTDDYEPLGGGGGGGSVAWVDVTGKPSTFPPDAHDHDDRYYTEGELATILGAYMKGPADDAEKVWAWTIQAGRRWATIDIPYSGPDTNPDFLRLRNGTGSGQATTPWRLNGNGESRHEPSAENRFGWISYEYPVTGSSDIFGGFRTNPSDAGLRETLFGMRGTKAGVTRPGYGVFSRGIETPALRLNGIDWTATAPAAPTFGGGTLWTADISGTYYPLEFWVEGGTIKGSGRVNLAAPNNYTADARIFTMPAGCIPARDVIMTLRSGGTGAANSFLKVQGGTGIVSFAAAITNATGGCWLQFDNFEIRKAV